MPRTKALHPSAPAGHAIIVAGCESLAETKAMVRWILPVLQEWPGAAWHIWMADATDCSEIKAAKVNETTEDPDWRPVTHHTTDPSDAVCSILGGRAGLVIMAHNVIAAAALRGLEGLVSAMTSFSASDPLAKPFKKSFASFGVTAGI